MKKRWKKLTAGLLMITALAVGGWMLTESLEMTKQSPTQINMEEVLVVRP